MIPMTAMLWIGVVFFTVLGMRRGWKKELWTLGLLVSVVFSILQLDGWFRHVILRFMSMSHLFALEAMILALVYFMAHLLIRSAAAQSANLSNGWRKRLLTLLWGGLLGGMNGYLFFTALWYLLDIHLYPFAPLITAPGPDTASAAAFLQLPLLGWTGGPFEVLLFGIVATISYAWIRL
ncbi:MAG: hypothetical protein OXF22_08240 [Anaerolineaceae bacterium]|nr:hypothetical protein [Anaerolineaceae bacterium]